MRGFESYSPNLVEGFLRELRPNGFLVSPSLEDASSLLPNPHPLACTPENVGLVGIEGIGARAADHHVLNGRNVPRLEEVVASPAVEAIQEVSPPYPMRLSAPMPP